MDSKSIDYIKLHDLMSKIYPVIEIKGKLFRIKNVHPTDECITWNPKAVALVEGLIELKRLYTVHSCPKYGLFKPTTAEVLSTIPDDLIDSVVAFRVVPESQLRHSSGSYFTATTILYTSVDINPTIVPKMRIYACTDHEGHWPVGVASVVVAECEDDARELLYAELGTHGLVKREAFTLAEIDTSIPAAYVLNNGDY